MKIKNTLRLCTLTLIVALLLPQTSCIVYHQKDNGKRKGWNKNPNNPHHPRSTNPGKSRGRSK